MGLNSYVAREPRALPIFILADTSGSMRGEKINELKAAVRDGVLKVTADTRADITMEKLAFEEAAVFFKEVFGLKAELAVRKR